jgi:hypothetical protein
MQLSKTDYITFLKHPAWMWLKKHAKETLAAIEIQSNTYAEGGELFETYAEKLFPEGITIGFNTYDEYVVQPERTREALQEPSAVVFQGRFEKDSLTCVSDIVVHVTEHVVDLYEIKASTRVDPLHEYDLAFQKHILELCGYVVENCKLILVNTEYIRLGDIDPEQLVVITDVTNAVSQLSKQTSDQIEQALRVLHQPFCPDLNPTLLRFESLKHWMPIYRSLKTVPDESIYDLTRLSVKQLQEFEEHHIELLSEITDQVALRKEQQIQVQAVQSKKILIDIEKIKQFLDSCVFPLYFLDYETISSVIPPFDRVKPYQQVPFQYSLHILSSIDSQIEHTGYLHRESSNPVEQLSVSLKQHIGEQGTIFVWYEGFEKERNKEMAQMCPAYEHMYTTMNERIKDLMLPFSSGWYADARTHGSASIKKVLPVLLPDLSYENLTIKEGGTASRIWMETCVQGKYQDNKEQLFHDLDEYCTRDTYAMVKIYQFLTELTNKG